MTIGCETLTDDEFEVVEAAEIVIATYSQETYDVLSEILESRDAVSTSQERLVALYTAHGVEVVEGSTAKSNIYIGDVLE